jgi:hypothetical protein
MKLRHAFIVLALLLFLLAGCKRGPKDPCAAIANANDRDICAGRINLTMRADGLFCLDVDAYKDECYRQLALRDVDPGVCNNIQIESARADCKELARQKELTRTCADFMPVAAEFLKTEDDCHNAFAMARDSPAECDLIADASRRDACHAALADPTDPARCTKTTDPRSQDLCYLSIAQVTGESFLCAKLQADDLKELCPKSTA